MTASFEMRTNALREKNQKPLGDDLNERMVNWPLCSSPFEYRRRAPPQPPRRREKMKRKAGVKEGVQRSDAGAFASSQQLSV